MNTSNDVIGFAGIGAMGTPMAGNLARAGYKLVVFDLDAARAAALAREHDGVAVAASLAGLGAAANVVITMLPDGKAVRTALCGANDSFRDCILERAAKDTLVIDMSSSSPVGTRELGKLLA
ncbi:MAG: NAD(P)-dependent oxidoreductase, partial [Burkholderiales bacterium]|nr:NAD(P)-dependent oxidoreductase [Burkholderiales bacterium]